MFVLDVNSTVTGPDIQPGFHPEARYEFKVHFDGADLETLTYRISFGEPDSRGRQHLRLVTLTGDEAREDTPAGALVLEGQTGEAVSRGRHPDLGGPHCRPVLRRPRAAGQGQCGRADGTAVDTSA